MVDNIRRLVRPFIAVSFVTVTVVLFLLNRIDAKDILQTTGIVVGFYFGERAGIRSKSV